MLETIIFIIEFITTLLFWNKPYGYNLKIPFLGGIRINVIIKYKITTDLINSQVHVVVLTLEYNCINNVYSSIKWFDYKL